jgi:integrase
MSTRRGTGEGAVYHREDGRWAASVTVGYGPRTREARRTVEHPLESTRKRVTVYGRTRQEVIVKLRDLQRNVADGLPVVDQRTTLEHYLEGWLERVAPRLRPATLLRYSGLVRGQLIPHLGRIRLARLSPADVAKMLAAIQMGGLSPRTASHARAVLRTALSDAEKWGLTARNVAKLTDPPSVPAPSPKMLPIEDVHRVLDAASATEVANEVTLALYSGMRVGEVLGLRWSDVALDAGLLTVSHALQRLGTETKLVEPKSASSHRTLQLPEPAIEALRNERQRQVARQLAAGSKWRPTIDGLVFTDATGRPLVPISVTRTFQRALRAAGLPPLRFHHLRHLHAGLMLGSGIDIATVSHLLGHSSVALTASTYAGVMPALKREAAARFERLLSREG